MISTLSPSISSETLMFQSKNKEKNWVNKILFPLEDVSECSAQKESETSGQ